MKLRILQSSLIFLIITIILLVPTIVSALHAVPMENLTTIGADASVGRTFQRDTFYGASRAWVFFMGYDGAATHIYYRSSPNGIAWTARTQFCDVTDADEFSLHWDGTFIHTTWVANDGVGNGVNYRRGTPNSDGTITWSAVQAVYIPSVTDNYVAPTITAYASRPYIAYGHTVGPIQLWGATSSNQTNGTWAQDLVFENTTLAIGAGVVEGCIDALSSGVIHVALSTTVAPAIFPQVGSVRYTAGGWQGYETIIDSAAFGDNLCSTVPWGNQINVITNFVPGNNISHRQSGIGGIWAIAPAAQVISLNSYIQATVSVWDNTDGDLKCFFSAGLPNNISWKHYDNVLGTWDAGFFGLDDPVTVNRMNSAQIHSSPLGVVYENNLAPDSDVVYYDYLDAFPPYTPPLSSNAAMNNMVVIIVLIFILAGILLMLALAKSGNAKELIITVVIIVVGVAVAMGIWLNS
jgi:hypothetical protein